MPKKEGHSKKVTKRSKKTKPSEEQRLETVARKPIASSAQISKNSLTILWRNRAVFSGIILIYGIVYVILVQGFVSTSSTSDIKGQFTKLAHGNLSSLVSGLGAFTFFISSSNSSSTSSGSSYQAILILIVSLSIIWALRQLYSSNGIRVRDAFYKGLYPLIPFLLVLLLIAIELLPLVIGTTLYNAFISGGIAVNLFEKTLALIILIPLVLLSLYFISSSIFALYIVTLPDMTPMTALRSAKGLVKGRRALIMRKVIFLPIMLLVAIAVIMLPFILVAQALAVWVFFILSLLTLLVAHSYLYSLYRELIK